MKKYQGKTKNNTQYIFQLQNMRNYIIIKNRVVDELKAKQLGL